MNDTNCFALSEARGGAAAGAKIAFDAILGTGCGSDIVVRGELLTDTAAVSGELGDNPLPWPEDEEIPGLLCDYGKHGCIETFISGTGLSRQNAASTGEQFSAKKIMARAVKGDTLSISSMERYESRVARAFAPIINVIDPVFIVLGGGTANVTRLDENIRAQCSDLVFSAGVTTQLRPPRLGDPSGVRGAAWLWPAGVAL